MVDFQERDTRRAPGEADDDGDGDAGGEDTEPAEKSREAADRADDATDRADDAASDPDEPVDGEAEIDEVRQQLEQRPAGDGGGTSSDGGNGGDSDEHGDGADDAHDDGADDAHDDADEGTDHDHHHHHDVETLGAAVVTVSSTRTLADDPSGDYAVEALVEAGHDVVTRELIPDDYDDVQHTVDTLVRRGDVDVVVSTGGTGVTPDDTTIEAVRPLFEKELPGFGELFRELSRDEIGTRVVATRATAGVADGVPVFCLPGSRDAVELGVEEIIVHEAPHLAGLARRDEAEAESGSAGTEVGAGSNGREVETEPDGNEVESGPSDAETPPEATGRSDGGQPDADDDFDPL